MGLLPALKFRGRRSWQVWIVFFVLVLLILSRVSEYFLTSHDMRNWDSVVDGKCARDLAEAEAAFNSAQRIARRAATELAQHPVVQAYLSGRSQDRFAVFGQVSQMSRAENLGIELYDRRGTLVAWAGRSGPAHKGEIRIALDGQLTSYVDRTPIASQLFVVIPARQEGSVIGAVLVRNTIEVSYPLNNAYINSEGMAEELSRSLGVAVEFNFNPNAGPRIDGRYLTAPLYGIDSSRVGSVSVQRPVRSAFFEGLGSQFQVLNSLLLVILFGIIGFTVAHRSFRLRAGTARILVVTAIIWLIRYALLWLDVPSGFLGSGIFDPGKFAATFGAGLAKSVGEMTLTCIALTVNVGYIALVILRGSPGDLVRRFPQNILVRLGSVEAVVLLLFWVLRGYGAAVRSVVFDSTLRFTDPKVLFPSFDLAMMVLNVFLLTFCLIVLVYGCMSLALALLAPADARGNRRSIPWIILGALLAATAVVFGMVQEQPLMSTSYRLFFGAVALLLTAYLRRPSQEGKPLLITGNLFVVLPLAVLLFFPLLDGFVHERDRQRIEVLADEVLRPVDSWFEYLVDEGLKSFMTDDTIDLLRRGDSNDVSRLAFVRWAQSTACREGYTSVFAVTDPDGHEISRFAIGGQAGLASQVDTSLTLSSTKIMRVTEIGKGIESMKVYAGSIPIETPGDTLLGYGKVVVAAGQQTLFRGENPAILRGASQENLETFYRPVTISEFRDGVLLTTNDNDLPIGYTLPPRVRELFKDTTGSPVWTEEIVAGNNFESYYIPHAANGRDVVALSLHELGIVWHLIAIEKVLLYFAVITILFSVAVFAFRRYGGYRHSMTFRDRLLIALLVTAIVPLGLILLYGRYTARLRLMESTGKRLDEETATISSNLTDQPDAFNRNGLTVGQAAVEQIAGDVGTDFNLYVDNQLRATSRPELYEAGILDRRLSGTAYANVVIGGRRFFLETESIGLYEYAVGYRPVLDPAGAIVGVVSVPTLYRQDQLDEDVSRRNAFLFGVYALVLLSVILIATTLANRIAAPIQRLTDATRKVSRGELDVSVQASGADGEVGELIRSFESMTRDLQASRKELVRYERELAWKEMAKQVAHEIKNPLTPMKLAVQHLRQTFADKVDDFDRVLDEVTRTVINQIEALSRIASEFSDFARMPKRHIEPCDVKAILLESVRLFERDGNVQFATNLEEGAFPVLTDREELRRAFINIIRNGIQAMNNAGRMDVGLKSVSGGIRVTIRDFGPGISEEVKSRLFEPNFSTKTDGMGLGLAIVKKTIDDIGGSISIESVRAQGTTVTLFLPTPNEKTAESPLP